MSNSNFINDWSNAIKNMKTKVIRIYKKSDPERKIPFVFDGWTESFLTGEKLISIHTKMIENKNGEYLSYVLNEETFNQYFEEVEIEI